LNKKLYDVEKGSHMKQLCKDYDLIIRQRTIRQNHCVCGNWDKQAPALAPTMEVAIVQFEQFLQQ